MDQPTKLTAGRYYIGMTEIGKAENAGRLHAEDLMRVFSAQAKEAGIPVTELSAYDYGGSFEIRIEQSVAAEKLRDVLKRTVEKTDTHLAIANPDDITRFGPTGGKPYIAYQKKAILSQ
jgi:hypothetical protein